MTRSAATEKRRRGDAEAVAKRPRLPKEIAEQIRDREERAAYLMRTATALQAEAMRCYAEIAVLSQMRNYAWQKSL